MASDKDSYLTVYRRFFEDFAATCNPDDQLPVKLASYKFNQDEITGGVIDWTLQYLSQKHCPSSLVASLVKTVIDEVKQSCKKQPDACGFNQEDNAYEPLKLMQAVMSKVNEICLRYLDNSQLDTLPAPCPCSPPLVSACAVKNSRRRMEDRHIIIDDLHTMFGIQDLNPTSYYAVFDGHAGQEAASYSVAHLHQYLVESPYYPTNPESALKEAFLRTDASFIEKAKKENLVGGTTALCALLRPKHGLLYIAWVGDSLALLVKQGQVVQIVKPHKPSREDEKDRVEEMGGLVVHWGIWRVNGQLAVSRAIGDAEYKPYVTSDPDIRAVPLSGGEDFLILACDGLWDFVTEDEAAVAVYRHIISNPDDVKGVSQRLVQLSKEQGSSDNISVIVVFLRDPHQIIASPCIRNAYWSSSQVQETQGDSPNKNNGRTSTVDHQQQGDNNMDALETSAPPQQHLDNSNAATNNPFSIMNNSNQKNNMMDLNFEEQTDVFLEQFNKQNGCAKNQDDNYKTNGKRSADEFDEEDDDDDDYGPETDVDTVDDVLLSPAKALAGDNSMNNNPFSLSNDNFEDALLEKIKASEKEFDESEEDDVKDDERPSAPINFEVDFEIQRQQLSDFDPPLHQQRDETPTPPADAVLDTSSGQLAENVADSGDDSEDEWNYYKVDPKENKTDILQQTTQQVCEQKSEETAEEDEQIDMSRLNPDAAEFVPVSPTHSASPLSPQLSPLSPANVPLSPTLLDAAGDMGTPKAPVAHRLFEDIIQAQSPNKPLPMNNRVPSPNEFIEELEKRPSSKSENEHKSSQELMENLLNGKNVEEIEFHPQSENMQLNNMSDETASSFMESDQTKSKNISQALFTEADFNQAFNSNTHDPMSMSFYQNIEGEPMFSHNPFDLNKVQLIPDNIDEIVENKEPVSDLDVDNVVNEIQSTVYEAEKAISDAEEKEQESPIIENKIEGLDIEGFGVQNLESVEQKSPIPNNDLVLEKVKLEENKENIEDFVKPEQLASPLTSESTGCPLPDLLVNKENIKDIDQLVLEESFEAVNKENIEELSAEKVDIKKDVEQLADASNLEIESLHSSNEKHDLSDPKRNSSAESADVQKEIEESTKMTDQKPDLLVENESLDPKRNSSAESDTVIKDIQKAKNSSTESAEADEILSDYALSDEKSPDPALASLVDNIDEPKRNSSAESYDVEKRVASAMSEEKQNLSDPKRNSSSESTEVEKELQSALEDVKSLPIPISEEHEIEPENLFDNTDLVPQASPTEKLNSSDDLFNVSPSEKMDSPVESHFDVATPHMDASSPIGLDSPVPDFRKVGSPIEIKTIPENLCQLPKSPLFDNIEESKAEEKDVDLLNMIPTQNETETCVLSPKSPCPENLNQLIESPVLEFEPSAPLEEEEIQQKPDETSKSTVPSDISSTPDIHSFLTRSEVPDVMSPLDESNLSNQHLPMDLNHPLMKCVYPLPTNFVNQDFDGTLIPQPPSTDSNELPKLDFGVMEAKSSETPPSTPAVAIDEPTLIPSSPEKLIEAVEKLTETPVIEAPIAEVAIAAAAGVVAAAAVATTAEKKASPTLKSKTGVAPKKSPSGMKAATPLAKPAIGSATKKTPVASSVSKLTPKLTPSKPTPPKTTTSLNSTPKTNLTSRPKTVPILSKSLDKKAIEKKASDDKVAPKTSTVPKRPLTASTVSRTASNTLTSKTTSTTKTSNGLSKPLSKPLNSTISKTSTTTTTITKTKPTTLTSKTSSTTTRTSMAPARPLTATTRSPLAKTSTTTVTSAAAKPRVTSTVTRTTKTATGTKPSLTDKQVKESTNKQLSARATSVTKAPSAMATTKTSATNVRKTESSTATSTFRRSDMKPLPTKARTTELSKRTAAAPIKKQAGSKTPQAVPKKSTAAAVPAVDMPATNQTIEILPDINIINDNQPLLTKDESPVAPIAPQLDNSQIEIVQE